MELIDEKELLDWAKIWFWNKLMLIKSQNINGLKLISV